MLTGADESGRPLLVKILIGEACFISESMAVDILQLENPIVPLVPARTRSIDIKGINSFLRKYECVIMPQFTTTASKMESLFSINAIVAGGERIKNALHFIHSRGLVHMDVKPPNIFVDTDGNWFLGDYGSCVKIGETIHSCSEQFLPVSTQNQSTTSL